MALTRREAVEVDMTDGNGDGLMAMDVAAAFRRGRGGRPAG